MSDNGAYTVDGTGIPVAYFVIAVYILFDIIALAIVSLCFKERTGIAAMKAAPDIDPYAKKYDPSVFNADVNINMNSEIDLADKFRLKRAKTETEMVNLEPRRMKSNDNPNLNQEDDEEIMFNDIDLANNPLSNDSNNMIQQLKLNGSKKNNNNNDTSSAIHLINPNQQSSYHGNAIRLEDLPNLPEPNPYDDYVDDDDNKTMPNHSYNDSVQTIAIKSQFQKPKINGGYIHMHSTKSSSVNYTEEEEVVNISMNNNNKKLIDICFVFVAFLRILNLMRKCVFMFYCKRKEITVTVEEDDDHDDNCLSKLKEGKCVSLIIRYLNKSTSFTPIFFHFWDMATDLAVLCDWMEEFNWREPNKSFNDDDRRHPNTFYFVIASLVAMLIYRMVSGYRYAKRFNICGGLLQFLDIMLFFESYASWRSIKGQSTLQLRWIRKMESVLESAPQAFIQLVYVLTLNDNPPVIVQLSLILSILSITSSVVRSDEWKVEETTKANNKCPPNWRFITRAIFRLFEISTRLFVMALLSQIRILPGLIIVVFILGLQMIFYLIMYKDGFLGNDLGNIIEILIVHPNLSLRISDEELKVKTESTFGWIFRTLLCWTPIAGLLIFFKNDKDRSKHKTPSLCNMCIHSNLVTVHFTHRCFESFIELVIFIVAFYFDNDYDMNQLFETNSFLGNMFIVAIFGTITTPFLYLITYRWFITGQDGLEMNVFGFLHQAHHEDDITQFARFVYRVRSSVNEKNKFNRTPLMEAVLLKNYEICKFLCSLTDIINLSITDKDDTNNNNNNDKDDDNVNGKQVIHYVAELGDARLMKLILDAKRKQDDTLFGGGGHNNKHNIIQMDIDAYYGKQEKTALIVCSESGESGHAACAKLLLESGCNVNYQDTLGRTSLHYAIFGESSNEIPDISNEYKLLVKTLLSFSPNLTLFDNKRQWTALFQAVGGGSIDIVDLLINIGLAPLDTIDLKGESLLHVAVRYNRFNVLKYLLTQTNNKRWNLQHKNKNNETPLKLSILCKYTECMKVLIRFGNESIKELMKGLLLAVKINSIDIVKILIRQFKVDPNFTDKDEMTPLRWAAFNGYKLIMKELLIGGARDDPDQFGQNIVFYAAKNNNTHILQLLKKANADFCVVNFEGQSATDKTNEKQTIQFIQSVRNMQLQYH